MALWSSPATLAAGVLVAAGAWVWLRTEAGNDWLLARLLPLLQPQAGAIEVGRLRTDLWRQVRVQDVVLRDPDGAALVTVAEAEAEVEAQSLIGRVLPVRRLEVRGLDVRLPDPGVFARMWPSDPAVPPTPWRGLPVEVSVDAAHVEGRADVAGQAFEALRVDVAVHARGKQVAWNLPAAEAQTAAGPLALRSVGVWSPERTVVESAWAQVGDAHPNRVSLGGALDADRLALTLHDVHFDAAGLAPLVPALAALPLAGPVDATGAVRGTVSAPEVTLTLATPGGPVEVSGAVVPQARAWRAAVDTPGLDVDRLTGRSPPVHVRGRVHATGVGWTWPDALEATGGVDVEVQAAGQHVAVTGAVQVAEGVVSLRDVAADGGWVSARVEGEADVPAQRGTFSVERSTARLGRFGVGGSAGFAGRVEVGWPEAGAHVRAVGDLVATELAAADATLRRVEGPVDVSWVAAAPADARATGVADLLLRDLHYQGRGAALGTLHAELGSEVRWELALHEPDRQVAQLDGSVVLATREVVLTALDVELGADTHLRGRGTQRARVVPGGVADAALDLGVGRGRVQVDGGVSTEGSDRLLVNVTDLDLAELGAVLGPETTGWAGRVSGRVGVVGRLAAPTVDGHVEVHGVGIPGRLAGLEGWLTLEADGTSLRVEGEAGDAAHTVLLWDVRLPVQLGRGGVRLTPDGPLSGAVELPPVGLAELRDLLGGVALPEVRTSAAVVLGGTVDAPAADLDVSADLPLGTGGPTVRAWLDGGLHDGVVQARLVLNQAFVSRGDATFAARLDVPRLRSWLDGTTARPEPRTLVSDFGGAVILKQLPVATLRHFADFRADVDGALAGAFAVDGSPFAPRIQGGVNVVDARVGQLRVAPATLELKPFLTGYLVKAELGFATITRPDAREGRFGDTPPAALPTCAARAGDPAGQIGVTGTVPLDPTFDLGRHGLELKIDGAGVPLAAVEAFVPGMADTGGCFGLGGTITGSIAEPRLDLGLSLTHGATTMAPLGVRLEDIAVNGRFQGQQLALDRVFARTRAGTLRLDSGGGEIEAKGVLQLERWLPTRLDATVHLDRAWLSATSDRRAQVSGDLTVAGKGRNVDVTGDLRVESAFLNLAERFFSDRSARELHPDIHVLRPGAQAEAVAQGEAAPFPFTIRPRLTVDLARHMRLRAAMPLQGAYGDLARSLSTVVVETDVDGVVSVSHKAGDLRLTGEVATERGEARLLGRPFDLANGVVAFTGADYRQPILELRAVHHTTDCGDIVAAIGGVPGAPSIELSAEGDALQGDDAVLQTLLLGACPDSAEDPADDALDQTLSLVSQMLQKEVQDSGWASGEAVRIESVEIDATGAGSVGVALGRNLFLTTELDGAAEADENTFSVRIEVALPYRLYLSFDTGDRGVSSFAIRRKWRF